MIDALTEKLLASKKYRDVCPDTVARVAEECRGKYKKEKDADRAARECLHGITAAFLSDEEYKRAMRLSSSDEDLEALLACHASTRERLPLADTDDVYARLFSVTGVPGALLDLACGLNPAYLAARHPDMRITALDISGRCAQLLRSRGVNAQCADLLTDGAIPRERFDAALLFKILPLLERQRSGSATRVMEAIDAQYLIVSFPTRSLSGRCVGMAENYAAWMEAHLPASRAVADVFETRNEMYYILKER